MSIFSKPFAVAGTLLAIPCGAFAAEPVRQIGIYVQPFYESARMPGGQPRVAVGKQYNDLLSSNRREDILAARDLIVAAPKLVTPMTLMVLSIRLYDVGLRDEAVFWFYAAKDRFIVLSDVLDVKTPQLAQANQAVRAFCDLAKQKQQHAKAVDWVESNLYEVMFMARAPALPGDRAENHKRAIANAKERAAKECSYFDNAKNVEAFYATRKQNDADAKFCWK